MTGERAGIPSAAIMTDKFVGAAELMARVMGADGYPFIAIPHPMSSASPDELGSAARAAAEACAELLIARVKARG